MEIKIVINDRIVDVGKKLGSRRTLAMIAVLSVAVPVVLYADVPHVFQGGDPISAGAVNENFENLDERVGAYENTLSIDDKGNVGVGVHEPLADVNIYGNLSHPLTGQVGMVEGNPVLTGSATLFTEELEAGDAILVGNEVFTIANIVSDSQLELDAAPASSLSGVIAYTDSDLFAVQGGDGGDRVVIDKSGNVGIGTTGPTEQLQVLAAGTAGNTIYPFSFGSQASGVSAWRFALSDGNGAEDLTLQSAFSGWWDRVTIQRTSGNVGIGTTSPECKLHVIVDSPNPAVAISNAGAGLALDVGSAGMQVEGETWLAIDSGANVGIGTQDPKGKLDVNGSIFQRGIQLYADYVFEPDYQLESIEAHADSMWRERHLPAVPAIQYDEDGQEILEVGTHRRGMLEELEKAHVYIEQLNDRNVELALRVQTQQQEIKDLHREVARISALERRLAALEAHLAQ